MVALGSRWRKKGLAIDPARFETLGIDLEQVEVEIVAFNALSVDDPNLAEPIIAPIISGEVGVERWSVSEKSLTDNYELVGTPSPPLTPEQEKELRNKVVSSWGDSLEGALISNAN
jgi:hypothetical protein